MVWAGFVTLPSVMDGEVMVLDVTEDQEAALCTNCGRIHGIPSREALETDLKQDGFGTLTEA